jgi:hypothetical protein
LEVFLLSEIRDRLIDRHIAGAARRYAEDPEAFFFYATGLVLGLKESEVAERFKRIVEASA